MKHRREQILDSLEFILANNLLLRYTEANPGVDLREHFKQSRISDIPLYEDFFADPSDEFPFHIRTVQFRYANWTTLAQQKAIPAILMSSSKGRVKTHGGSSSQYASLGEVHEMYPLDCRIVIQETRDSKRLLQQESDIDYTLDRLIAGNQDLGVDGVFKVESVDDPLKTGAGALSNIQGTDFEIIAKTIRIHHLYRENTGV